MAEQMEALGGSAPEPGHVDSAADMIRVNDRHDVPWEEGMTISDVLEHLGYTYHEIIVKVDGELVRKASYDTYTVPDGADVKAIHLIAGG